MGLAIAYFAAAAFAASNSAADINQINCDGQYTLYTHPGPRCREKLAEEYKQLIEQFLSKGRDKK